MVATGRGSPDANETPREPSVVTSWLSLAFAVAAGLLLVAGARRYATAAGISSAPILIEHAGLAAAVAAIWAALAVIPAWRPLSRRLTPLFLALAVLWVWGGVGLLRGAPEAARIAAALNRVFDPSAPATARERGGTSSDPLIAPTLTAIESSTDTLETLADRYARLTQRCKPGDWLLPERLQAPSQLEADRACCDSLIAEARAAGDYEPRYRDHLQRAFARLSGPHRHLARAMRGGLGAALDQAARVRASNLAVAMQYRLVFDTLLERWGHFSVSATGIQFKDADTESTLAHEMGELEQRLRTHEELTASARMPMPGTVKGAP